MLLISLLPFFHSLFAQVPATIPVVIEQQLENLTENTADAEIEDDSWLQAMLHFMKEPINLNAAVENDLNVLKVLTPLQIQNFLSYRNLFGNFINVYELQAIPGWNVSMIRKIRPYISVQAVIPVIKSFKSRFHNGQKSVLLRMSEVLEKANGYERDSTKSFYAGSRQKIFFRYKFSNRNLLQYGVSGEKDPGEQFFKGSQKAGFDFYSAHFYAKDIGIIKTLALGDYSVNLGQGLIQWQSLAFKKSADGMNIKRQSEILEPYNSSGEINFNRGAGITLKKKNIETTLFFSDKKIDANLVSDTLNNEDFVSSLQTSGYHRTMSEASDKHIQRQVSFGANFSLTKNKFHLGINGIRYQFNLPIVKDANLYNKYAISGRGWGNYSLDYSFTYKNLHVFGEAAIDKKFDKAFLNGLLISVDRKIDMSFLYRHIANYESLYSSAFTENTLPTNEAGMYAGIVINPTDVWRIDAYVDLYKFPWVKYRVDAPSYGKDYFIQLTYKPDKKIEIYSRYKTDKKQINNNPDQLTLNPVIFIPRQSWRTQFSYKTDGPFTLRSRIEYLWFNNKSGKYVQLPGLSSAENGYLFYADLLYKPFLKHYSGNMRLQYFETGGYNSRMYAYEDDVLFSYSIPVFYDKGYRYYINFNYDLTKKISFWIRFAQSVYPAKTSIGTGLDEIPGNKKTEIKLQIMLSL
ncbi:MAG: helix-hairpin-helix domain-containing protein [Chitinophagaceae bacterium]|nr:helix-hairpin-helix domain-containing protein [Chitinophagaceae bacterium]